MIIDWRVIFNKLGVEWRDRGSNCTRGNVNIKCPFCINDPSFHLAVAEEKHAYFCYRDNRHHGGQLIQLLIKLGCSPAEAPRLLQAHTKGSQRSFIEKPEVVADQAKIERAWDRFEDANAEPDYLAYLRGRGFDSPALICTQYDLRFAQAGKWARRLLMPFRDHNGELITFVGRSIDNRIPSYLMDDEKAPGSIYLPRVGRKQMEIVEGPMDALKIAAATEAYDISAVALAGKGINAPKLLRLKDMCRNTEEINFTLDAEVNISETNRIIHEVVAFIKPERWTRREVPLGFGDPAEMNYKAIQKWLKL